MFALQTVILPRGEGLTSVSRAVKITPDAHDGVTPLFGVDELHPYTAHEVCGWLKASHLEKVEDPHGHPEPPSDKILHDFFVAVYPQHHHH